MGKVGQFECTTPCNNCPYRKDAPLQHWDKFEYEKLLKMESEPMGSIYGCHKDNGSICVGWLMKQDEANLPSIKLRLALTQANITREYLDRLKSTPLYKSVREMVKANYPNILKKKRNDKMHK